MKTGSIVRIVLSIVIMVGVLLYLYHSAAVATKPAPILQSTVPARP